jgi:hypothetical protein
MITQHGISCHERLVVHGLLIGEAINGIRDTREVPPVGCLSWGEFGRTARGKPEFHHISYCRVALKEN